MHSSIPQKSATAEDASSVAVMESSELERAAVALASAQHSLKQQLEMDRGGASKSLQVRGAPQTGGTSASAVALRR
jgi:hypothetical protein